MKRLVVCCDGTWNAPEKLEPQARPPTNVLRISRAILPVDDNDVVQAIEYIRGIGTRNLLDRMVGGVTGKGISSNILQAYQFISNNFLPGDHIYLFGFSRGAYTARSLSGFINHFGILRKEYQHLLPYIYNLYQRTPKDQLKHLVANYEGKIDRDLEDRERRCIPIHFLGAWDTVGALGAPLGMIRRMLNKRIGFHDTDLAPNVTYAYHALAIHEYRKDFSPTLWTNKHHGQVVEQVWFPGSHSDVGGGLAETGLSNQALLWVADRAMRTGLAMNDEYLGGLEVDPMVPVTKSRTGLYKLRPPYVRPIGPNSCDGNKPHSLDEFRHVTARSRIAVLNAINWANRPSHEIEADNRSLHPMLPETD
jgi:uncharacterized protein (DUF2235 family)